MSESRADGGVGTTWPFFSCFVFSARLCRYNVLPTRKGLAMGMLDRIRRMIKGSEPSIVDYDAYQATGTEGPSAEFPHALPAEAGYPEAGPYKLQQSYDSLLQTVRELREALDGQQRRQEDLLSRLSTLPQAAEALPQTTKMQADMLRMINDRLAMHAEQQRRVGEVVGSLGKGKSETAEALQGIKEQIEMSNEIDRQLVESFNRFSVTIDRLHVANNHAVEALQQVRDSYAQSALQMHEWIEKSRTRNKWLLGGAFAMSFIALAAVIILLIILFRPAGH